LESLLRGQDALHVVLSGLLESTSEAVTSCREILDRADATRAELEHSLQVVEHENQQAAQTIAASLFPGGRLVELAVDVSRENLHWSARLLRYPAAWIARQFKPAIEGLLRWLSPRSGAEEVKQRGDLERDRLHLFVERLIDRFRSLYPEQAAPGAMLDHARCAGLRDALFAESLPQPSEDWETVVRQALQDWCRDNRWRSHLLVVSADVMLAAGAAAIVIDLGTTGGMIGTVGLTALAGAGSVAAGRVLERFGGLELRKVAEQAYDRWREQRCDELASHLQQHFSEPLFDPWRRNLTRLKAITIGQCIQACRELSGLAKDLGVSR
jgi:hypothetical protein